MSVTYRIDETYIKVRKNCKYLYRAVDSTGQTIEFMLSAKRDVPQEKMLPLDYKLRRVKYLNNIIEQEHRFIKKRVRACLGYCSFDTVERTIQ